jgi:[protein-PII] uridylyltransferase
VATEEPLNPIPEALDPVRIAELAAGERLQLYKEYMSEENARIRTTHDQGGGGCEVASLRSGVVDVLLRSLFETAAIKSNSSNSLTLVANGGYGRGLLNPGSDIDLLFLLSQPSHNLDTEQKELVSDILYPLFDLGFKVGHASRSIPECITEARRDPITRTSLFDHRKLCGNESLYRKFAQRFRQDCINRDQVLFFEERRSDIEARYRKFSSTVFLQEPNLKESPGGMRDFHNLLWISDALFNTRDLEELRRRGILTTNASNELREGFDFLHRLRNCLHYHTEKSTDILTLRFQGVVTEAFKYRHKTKLRRIEALMRDYYLHARDIHQHTASVFEIAEIETPVLRPFRLPSWVPFSRKSGAKKFDGFTATDGRLFAEHENIFAEEPGRLLHLFLHCQKHHLRPSPPLRKLIKANWHRIDKSFNYNQENRRTFRTILEKKGQVARTLRLMHRCGVLGRYFPEFGALECLVQHEFFHRYTADEHTLRCIDQLDALIESDDPALARYRQILIDIEDPYALYLAVLLHDSGRAENVREHIDGSQVLANKVCKRLQIRHGRRQLIMFLVDHHLTLWRFATKRNIDDPDVVAEFAGLMKNRRFMDALLLFTYADSNGTNEDAWGPWKETLIIQLCKSARAVLKQGYGAYDAEFRGRLDKLREKVRNELHVRYADITDEHFRKMPKRYFRYRDALSVGTHIRAIWQYFDRRRRRPDTPFEAAVQWIEYPEQGYTELTVATHDRHLLLEKICCSLAAHEINILSADIYTREDGVALDIFRVCTDDMQAVKNDYRQMSVVMTLYEINQQENYLPDRYLEAKNNFLRENNDDAIPFPVRAYIDNESDPRFTVIEVQAIDRIGLLHDLLYTINQHGLHTIHARIATEKGAALDTFYVRTSKDGDKLNQIDTQASLQEALEEVILAPRSVNPGLSPA